nr:reverse transcriptase domain-containing protein [Tanacetum cinerariifolium]
MREDSQNSSAKTLFARYCNPSERPQIRDRLKNNDGNVFGWLGYQRQSAFKRLSNTYSPSTTKSGPDTEYSRDGSYSRGRPHKWDSSPSRDRPQSRDCSHGIEESYGDPDDHVKIFQAAAQNQPRDGRGSNKFTLLTRTPKEIFVTESGKFKPPPMVTPIEKKSNNKFCKFHNDKGHSTDECVQLRMQIEELGRAGKLSHFIKEIRRDRDQQKTRKKGCFSQRQSRSHLYDTSMAENDVTEGDAEHYTKVWMNFMIVRSPSPYNGIIGRLRIRKIQAVPSTAHGMLKFPVNGGIVTIRSSILMPTECTTIVATPKHHAKKAKARHENFKVAINLDFPKQEITIGGTVSIKARMELCTLLKRNLDIFAWKLIVTPFQKLIEMSNPSTATPLNVYWMPTRAIIKYRWLSKIKKRRLSTPVTWYIATQKCPSASRMLAPHTSGRQSFLQTNWSKPEDIRRRLGHQKSHENRAAMGYRRNVSHVTKDQHEVEKSLPLFNTLKKCIKKSDFQWTPDAEQAFKQLMQHLAKLPMLIAPKPMAELIMYVFASYRTISAVLMTERDTVQTLVYFVSRALHALELNYTPMEKLVLALVCAAKKLCRYFQVHPIVVITDQPIKQGVGLILTNPEGTKFTYTLRFQVTAFNNEVEYETLIASLRIAAQMEFLDEVLKEKSIQEEEVATVVEEGTNIDDPDNGIFKRWDPSWRSFLKSWLRCVGSLQVDYVIQEIHEGSCSMHAGPRFVVAKAMRLGKTRKGQVFDSRYRLFHKVERGESRGNNHRDSGEEVRVGQHSMPFRSPRRNSLGQHRAYQSLGEGIKARLEAVIPIEIRMPMYRTTVVDAVNEELRLNLDLLEERREYAVIREAKAKLKMTKYYNTRVRGVTFRPGDFVYRSNEASHAIDGESLVRSGKDPMRSPKHLVIEHTG